jgi:two-component system, NarL family, sensor histidine kinase DegS
MADASVEPIADLEGFTTRLGDDLAALDRELGEVDLLIQQARTEAGRHESRRNAAAEKFAKLTADGDAKERLDLTASLVTLTKRAALMESQVDVLEGKRRALGRYRDTVAAYLAAVGGMDPDTPLQSGDLDPVVVAEAEPDGEPVGLPAAVSRLVLSAQEDMRRDIARAMHDGPAQSLTNIVLQAQIVERLVERDPASAAGEVRQLTAMVQQTLDATKSFIFDVRHMVLDDLGIVPTLRRATRERGRRAGIPVDFDSLGQDRRLAMDLESGLFRMLDEALAAYLAGHPDRVILRLDWGDQLEARIRATRAPAMRSRPADAADLPTEEPAKDVPPALAAMMEDRRADEREAVEAAERDAIVVLPPTTWREIQGRAASVGVTAELLADGGEIRLVVDIPAIPAPSAGQGLVEYGLIMSLTSALTVVWLVVFGGAVADVLSAIARAIDRATGG